MATLIVDKTLSAIIDVSQFESDADKARFATAFADRFFFRKKAQPSAVHLFIEECQEFVPQNPQRGEERMLHAFIRMQKLGRNFGIGSSYISQRPQEVNKKALNMAQTLFVFRTTGSHERTAIEKWIEDKSLDQSIANDLPKINTGDCHVWSPEFLKISETVHILSKDTFNASATPEVGRDQKVRDLAPIDLDKVRTEMAATIERAKAEDPKELRKELAAAKATIQKLERQKPISVTLDTTKDKPLLTDADRALLVKVSGLIDSVGAALASVEQRALEGAKLQAAMAMDTALAEASTFIEKKRHAFLAALDGARLQKIRDKIAPLATVPAPPRHTPAASTAPRPAPERSRPSHSRPSPATGGSGEEMSPGERSVLTAIAMYETGVTRDQLGVLTGYKKSSRDTYIGKLSGRGWIEAGAAGHVVATQTGIDALGDFEPLPTGDALLAWWRPRLSEGERAILDVIVHAYPNDIERTAIDEATDYKKSSRDTYLGKLAARRLIVSSRGSVRASEELFS